MFENELVTIKVEWAKLKKKLSEFFDTDLPDLETVLFLVGVQELGQGPQSFTKEQKMDLVHIGTCKVLGRLGYYEFDHTDSDGWPHWKILKPLPPLNFREQDLLLKKATLDHFVEIGFYTYQMGTS